MKNIVKFFGIAALAAVIGFSFIGCGDDDSDNASEQPVVTGVTVSPAETSVAKGGSQTFTAVVTGTNKPAQAVTWSIVQTNKHAQTTISGSGQLNVASAETLVSLTVRATSTANKTKYGSATVTISGGSGNDPRPAVPESMSAKTAMQYFTDEGISIGINAGNSLDAVDSWTTPGKPLAVETAWGNPKLNQAYFNGLADLGMKIVRIPVTWNGHIGDAPNYKMDEAYLIRVAEVVGYAKNAGLKCFINVHHDGHHDLGGWLDIKKAVESGASKTSMTDKYVKLWNQIADYFKNFGDYLMFQGFNEIHDGNWGTGTPAEYEIINDWNKKFTDTVRASGGNNGQRYLLYYGYNTSYRIAGEDNSLFKLPADTASGRQIVGFHYYYPYDFSLETKNHVWDTSVNRTHLESAFGNFKTNFIDKGIPVIIGENGPAKYSNYPGNTGFNAANVETAKQNRLLFIDYMYGKARENGLVPIYWENGAYDSQSAGEGDFSLINRSNGQPKDDECRTVIQRMAAAINNTTPPIGETTPNPITGNMGNYIFGLQEDGISPNYTQARWELSGANLTNAKKAEAKLALVLQAAPTASMQLVWQGPANAIWWKQANILGDNGNILNGSAASWNESAKTLTLNLSSALDDYGSFTAQPSLNLIIAYYGGSSVNDLGIVSANLITE